MLAGERPGGTALNHTFAVPARVLVSVAGKPSLQRVMEAVKDSERVQGGLICGPTAAVIEHSEALQKLLQEPYFQWQAPATGPAASAIGALKKLGQYPALLTSGDHALLSGKILDDFCTLALSHANSPGHDFVLGLVPYALVQAAWPKSRRTALKFSSGHYCASNLFAILNPSGSKALSFWRQAEADRKHPWRIARRFGPVALLRYLLRRLTPDETFEVLSNAAGCSIGYVQLEHARAAIDIDSVADQALADKILSKADGISR